MLLCCVLRGSCGSITGFGFQGGGGGFQGGGGGFWVQEERFPVMTGVRHWSILFCLEGELQR